MLLSSFLGRIRTLNFSLAGSVAIGDYQYRPQLSGPVADITEALANMDCSSSTPLPFSHPVLSC